MFVPLNTEFLIDIDKLINVECRSENLVAVTYRGCAYM